MNAIVISMIANLYAKPNVVSELIDELLSGKFVRILKELEGDRVRVLTAYRYEGYTIPLWREVSTKRLKA